MAMFGLERTILKNVRKKMKVKQKKVRKICRGGPELYRWVIYIFSIEKLEQHIERNSKNIKTIS